MNETWTWTHLILFDGRLEVVVTDYPITRGQVEYYRSAYGLREPQRSDWYITTNLPNVLVLTWVDDTRVQFLIYREVVTA